MISNPLTLSLLSLPIGLNLAFTTSPLTMLFVFPLLAFFLTYKQRELKELILTERIKGTNSNGELAPRKPLINPRWTFIVKLSTIFNPLLVGHQQPMKLAL